MREQNSLLHRLWGGGMQQGQVQSGHLAPVTLLGTGVKNYPYVPWIWDSLPSRGRSPGPCCRLQSPSSRPQGAPELKGTLLLLSAFWAWPSSAQEACPGAWANRHLVISAACSWEERSASPLIPACRGGRQAKGDDWSAGLEKSGALPRGGGWRQSKSL